MKEREQEKKPQIIETLNANLGAGEITVESLAEKLGISSNTLYEWVRHDNEFSEALEIINEVQKDDPFRTGRPEDSMVNAGIIALLLLETKERIYKRKN
jgi:transposase-like protein